MNAGIHQLHITPLPNGSFHPDDASKDLDACGHVAFTNGRFFFISRDRKSQAWICENEFQPANVWD